LSKKKRNKKGETGKKGETDETSVDKTNVGHDKEF
jgi:hypothetical protein